MTRLILGTRASDLAMTQSRLVATALESAHPGLTVSLKTIRTAGDQRLDLDLRTLAGANGAGLDKGLFTRELEEALLSETIDLAVHSLKDLPTRLPRGLIIGATPSREDPGDVLVSLHPGGLDALTAGATVSTGSERRRLQLLAARSDLVIAGLRGNVPTRLRKLARGEAGEAIVLAAAGLKRLGLPAAGTFALDGVPLHITSLTRVLLPAVSQGILGIECRAADSRVRELLRALHHAPTWLAARAERALLRALGGGCQMPLGVATECHPATSSLSMQAVLFPDAHSLRPVSATLSGPARAPARLAQDLAAALKDGLSSR